MTSHTRRILDGAVDELKRNGYMSILLLYDTKAESNRLEVLCSETTDPTLLRAMAEDALRELSHPYAPGPVN
jgi:hypothetical protein